MITVKCAFGANKALHVILHQRTLISKMMKHKLNIGLLGC